MRLIILVGLLLCTVALSAQREAANWYFGNNAGLDFNLGTPVPLLDGQLNTLEGCESFSDAEGNLLFYTDGNTVWNRVHQVMENGVLLKGSFSTSQSALVVPNPVQTNIYYVFTPDDVLAYEDGNSEESNGFNYSVIDMLGDGGRGSVINKNIDLLANASENVTAVRNFEEDYYWVVTHYLDSFFSYKIDANGVDGTPVISRVGPNIDNFENFRGSIKISPDGSKLAAAHTVVEPERQGILYLYDFDSATGRVLNPTSLNASRVYYGVEFSSNSSKLYASGLQFGANSSNTDLGEVELVQFDLEEDNIASSEYVVHRYKRRLAGKISGALQIGIDKKIYHSIPNENLSVIRTPNLSGINCDFRPFQLALGNRTSSYGLPPFIQSFFETIVTIDNFCEGDLTTFDIEDSSTIQEVRWDFGDIESGADNFSEDFSTGHIFSAPGVYTVNVDVLYNNGSERKFIEFVEIVGVPQVAPDIELVQCDIDGVDDGITSFNLNESVKIFNNGNRNIKALFFDNLADAISNTGQLNPIGYTNLTNGQTIYARAFENAECFVIIEISLSVRPASNLGLYDTIAVCDLDIARNPTLNMNDILIPLQDDFSGAQSITFYASEEDALYELDPILTDTYTLEPLALPILYFRIENDDACDFIGSIDLSFIWAPDYEKQKTVVLCNNEANLYALADYDRYQWSNGENSESIRVDSTGIYEVTFTKGTCSYVQIFMVEESPKIKIDEIKVNDFRVSNEIVIEVSDSGQQQILYSIDDGLSFQESNTFQNLAPGVYEVFITNDCTELKETVVVGAIDSFFTPNNDGINDIWTFQNAEYFPNFSISIYDRYGKLIKTFHEAQEGWDGTYLERQMPSADYWYKLNLEGKREITGHFTLKR